MNIRSWILSTLIYVIMFHVALAEQDSLLYPELLRGDIEEAFKNEGTTSLQISFEDQIKFRTKAQFVYRGFKFNYRNRGESDQNIIERTSLSYSWKGLSMACGRGYINIAHGLILGYSMMKFSPAFSGQAGVRPVKIKVGAYDQYKELTSLNVSLGAADLSLFSYDGSLGATVEYGKDTWRSGLAVYVIDQLLLESWASCQQGPVKSSLNISVSAGGINHISADLLYKNNLLQCFGSAAWLSPEFYCIKKDSKWGSGLSPGSRGLAAGIRIDRAPWRLSGLGQSLLSDSYREEKCMLDLGFRKQPFEINGVYSLNHKNDLDESEHFPFGLTWRQSIKHNLKLNVKIRITKACDLTCQIQGDVVHERSYVGLFRLEYKSNESSIKFQLTRCAGFDNDLYFVRPAGVAYYGIRKAPNNETLFIDLIYAINIKKVNVYIHLRNEGVHLGVNYK